MATIAFTKIGSTVKMVKDTVVTYKPSAMVPTISGTTITYKYPNNIKYGFSFSTADTITAEGDPVSGTAVQIVDALAVAIF
jgi:hypothetical protein